MYSRYVDELNKFLGSPFFQSLRSFGHNLNFLDKIHFQLYTMRLRNAILYAESKNGSSILTSVGSFSISEDTHHFKFVLSMETDGVPYMSVHPLTGNSLWMEISSSKMPVFPMNGCIRFIAQLYNNRKHQVLKYKKRRSKIAAFCKFFCLCLLYFLKLAL